MQSDGDCSCIFQPFFLGKQFLRFLFGHQQDRNRLLDAGRKRISLFPKLSDTVQIENRVQRNTFGEWKEPRMQGMWLKKKI